MGRDGKAREKRGKETNRKGGKENKEKMKE